MRVDSQNGSISVIGESQRQDVEAQAAITASGNTKDDAEERLSDVVIDCERDPQGRLMVKASFPGKRRSNEGVSYVIRAPSVDGAELWSSNGAIRTLDITGELTARTSNGSVELDVGGAFQGEVRLRTSNGDITVTAKRDRP